MQTHLCTRRLIYKYLKHKLDRETERQTRETMLTSLYTHQAYSVLLELQRDAEEKSSSSLMHKSWPPVNRFHARIQML